MKKFETYVHILYVIQCHEVMQVKMKTEEGLGIEYDEDIVCAVCASVSTNTGKGR